MRTWCGAILSVLTSLMILAAGEAAEPMVVSAPPVEIVQPPPPKLPKLWSGGVEFGVNGTDGNSENFKVRLGANTKRETPDDILTMDILYGYSTAKSVLTEDRLFAKGRNEWILHNSPWSLFVDGSVEFDEFKAFDVRVASHGGVSYTFLKNDATLLKGRLGAGVAYEIGGPNDGRVIPEALVGFDFEQKISDRQKFTLSTDVFPELGHFGRYRAEAKAAYEILVDPEWNLTLKLGALDRYDSHSQGKKRNDVEYFMVLLWKY